MLRVFGIKTNKETGEVVKDKTLLFRCISENDYEKRGKKNAESHGYTVTEIWKIGTIANGCGNVKIS